jgi:hypothetical protein
MERQLAEALRALKADKLVAPKELQAALENAGCKFQTEVEEIWMPGKGCPGACGGECSLLPKEGITSSVLDVGGWKCIRHIPRRCRRQVCKYKDKRFWYNYVTDSEHGHVWFWDPMHELKYFFTCNTWGVSAAWLRQFTERAALQHVTFVGEAEVHLQAAIRDGIVNIVPDKARLKMHKAWFYWRVVVRVHQRTGNANEELINLYLPMAELLEQIWSWYPEFMFERRVQMYADARRVAITIVIDGNAKLARRICGRPVAELMRCEPLGRYTATQCSEKPSRKRKQCEKHGRQAEHGPSRYPPQIEVVVAHRRQRILQTSPTAEPYEVCLVPRGEENNPLYRRRWTQARWVTPKQLQEYWDKLDEAAYVPAASAQRDLGATSCKTHKEDTKTRRRARRCGWLYAYTPEGFVIHLKEYVGAESLPQRYFFLAEVIEKVDTSTIVRHDDACHLRKYAAAREQDSDLAKSLVFPRRRYITDGLHDKGHVDRWCLANCSPKAACNEGFVENVNSMVCEQKFSKLGRHKHAVRWMGRLTSAVFLTEMAEVRNSHMLAEQ